MNLTLTQKLGSVIYYTQRPQWEVVITDQRDPGIKYDMWIPGNQRVIMKPDVQSGILNYKNLTVIIDCMGTKSKLFGRLRCSETMM